jgi:hypothetical protein
MEDPNTLVELRTLANEFSAGVIASILDEAGIEASVSAGDSASLGVFGTTGFRPMSVWVRAEDVERAEEVLESHRGESTDLDWSEVDVGEPDPDDPLAQRIAAGSASGDPTPRRLILLVAPPIIGIALMVMGLGSVATIVGGIIVLMWAIGLVRSAMIRRKYR